MKSSILVYLSLWSLGVASVASQKMRGSSGTPKKTRRLQQNRTTFESYFEIEYLANGYGDIDFSLVGQALAIAYNNLLEPRFSNEEDALEWSLYDDPFNRRMELVEVLSVDGLRRLNEDKESRELQSSSLRNLNVNVRVTGSCRGCSSRSKFTNQVQRRMAKAKKHSKRKLQEKKEGGKGGNEPVPSVPPVPPPTSTLPPVRPPTSTLPPVPLPTLSPVPPPTSTLPPVPPPISTPPPTSNANTAPPVFVTLAPTVGTATAPPVFVTPAPTPPTTTPPPFDDPATLPTEEELRVAYALEIQRWEFDIIDVIALDEVDGPSTGETSSSRSGISSTRTSYYGGQLYNSP